MSSNSRKARTRTQPAPWVDSQSLSHSDSDIYETVATLEYSGHPADRKAIAAATGFEDAALDKALDDLTSRGVLAVEKEGGQPRYVLARRDWSAMPDEPVGHPMS